MGYISFFLNFFLNYISVFFFDKRKGYNSFYCFSGGVFFLNVRIIVFKRNVTLKSIKMYIFNIDLFRMNNLLLKLRNETLLQARKCFGISLLGGFSTF